MSRVARQSNAFGRAVRVIAALVVLAGSGAVFWTLTRVDLGRHAFLGDRQSLYDDADAIRSGETAQKRARLIGSAFDNAQAFWARTFSARADQPYRPASLVFFSRTKPSPCAGPNGATGHLYCAANGEAAFDLVFSEELSRRLLRDADVAEALLVGYVVAGRVQDQIGRLDAAARQRRAATGSAARAEIDAALARHADCLAGVWAADAAEHLGAASETFYRDTLAAARRAATALKKSGSAAPETLNLLDAGPLEDRGLAFGRGLSAADPSGCASP